jgi:hypothetical protein
MFELPAQSGDLEFLFFEPVAQAADAPVSDHGVDDGSKRQCDDQKTETDQKCFLDAHGCAEALCTSSPKQQWQLWQLASCPVLEQIPKWPCAVSSPAHIESAARFFNVINIQQIRLRP